MIADVFSSFWDLLNGNAAFILYWSAIIGASTVIYQRILKPLVNFGKKVDEIHDALPVLKRVAEELTNNGGSSIKDRVESVEQKLQSLHEVVEKRDDIAQEAREDVLEKIEEMQEVLKREIGDNKEKFLQYAENFRLVQLQMGNLIGQLETLITTK